MKLVNLRNRKILAPNLIHAQAWHEKAQGLIGKLEGTAIYFQTRLGVHTFGVKFPIDIVICDFELTVKRIFENVEPGHVVLWNPIWNNVFELPVGTAHPANLNLGDTLQIK